MSGTADDPIDLESLDAAITASDRPDSTVDQRVRARRAFVTKLNHLQGGAETPSATYQLAIAMLTQLTTSKMPERFGLTPAESETLRNRVIALMQDSRSKMGAEDIPIRTLQQRVSAKGKQIQHRRAKRVDSVIDSVRGGISPTSPPGDLSTLTRFPRGGPSSPLEDRMQSALAGISSALGQPKRPSDGPDRRDAARQRTPAKDRVAKRASDETDRDQDAKSPKPDSPEEVPIPTTPPSTPRASPARGAKRRSDSPEQQSSRPRPSPPDAPASTEEPSVPSPSRRDSAALALLSSGEPQSPSAIRRAVDRSARPNRQTSSDTRVVRATVQQNPMGVQTRAARARHRGRPRDFRRPVLRQVPRQTDLCAVADDLSPAFGTRYCLFRERWQMSNCPRCDTDTRGKLFHLRAILRATAPFAHLVRHRNLAPRGTSHL